MDRIAILCPGPSIRDWEFEDDGYFAKTYAVNQAVFAAKCDAFICLDGPNESWKGYEFPHHIPRITERHFPPVFPKKVGQFSFPTLLAYCHKHHPGAKIYVYGCDFGGVDPYKNRKSSANRWAKETKEVLQVIEHFEPGQIHWMGYFQPDRRFVRTTS